MNDIGEGGKARDDSERERPAGPTTHLKEHVRMTTKYGSSKWGSGEGIVRAQ